LYQVLNLAGKVVGNKATNFNPMGGRARRKTTMASNLVAVPAAYNWGK